MKFDGKMLLIIIGALLALYGTIILIRKVMERKTKNADGKWGYYISAEQFRYETLIKDEMEKFRYANFKDFNDFKSQFKASVMTAIKAKTIAEKKELLKESKKLFDLFLEDYPKLKQGYTLVIGLIIGELVPLVQRELTKLIFEDDGVTLKSKLAIQLCKMGQTGTGLFNEIYKKYIEGPLIVVIDQVFNQQVVKVAVKVVKAIGLDLKSLILTAVKGLAQDKIGDVLNKGVGYLESALSKVAKREISCRPPAAFATPEDIIVSETDQADFEDL